MHPISVVGLAAAIIPQIYAAPVATVTTATITFTSAGIPITFTTTQTLAGTAASSTASSIATSLASSTASSTSSSGSPAAATCGASSNGTSVSLSPSSPSGAVTPPSDFIGFGFETAFINDYANSFSENLVNNIANRVGAPIIIRVGGTSGDLVTYDPNQSEDKICLSGDCPIGSSASYSLGPSYFNGFKSFPNQQFSFQAPLPSNLNIQNTLAYVTNAYNAVGADRVAAIALGNEVDSFGGGYTIADYVSDALEAEKAITGALGLPSNDKIFEVLDLSAAGTGQFSVASAWGAGINSNGAVKYAAQHWYQIPTSTVDYSPQSEQAVLMSHDAIVAKFNSGYSAALQYLEANDPSVSFIISEGGTGLNGPPLEFQDAFGGALWVVDYELYLMSQGVKRVDQTGRPAAPHILWVPDTSANDPSLGDEQNIGPQVRGPYYGMPLVADFLGTNPGPVAEILSEDLYTAYATYDSSGSVARVALVNFKFWAAAVGGTRGSTTFDIPVSDNSITSLTVKRLSAASGAYALGYDNQGEAGMITYGGETWSYQLDQGNGSPVSGASSNETVPVCNGVASVTLSDSEAALVFFS